MPKNDFKNTKCFWAQKYFVHSKLLSCTQNKVVVCAWMHKLFCLLKSISRTQNKWFTLNKIVSLELSSLCALNNCFETWNHFKCTLKTFINCKIFFYSLRKGKWKILTVETNTVFYNNSHRILCVSDVNCLTTPKFMMGKRLYFI